METTDNPAPRGSFRLGPARVRAYFLNHLDRIYCAKLHLATRLPELALIAEFSELEKAIVETVRDVQNEIARMQVIYTLLDAIPRRGSTHGVNGLIDDAFEAISLQQNDPHLSDLSIIFYLQNIEGIEMSSFQVLQIAAAKIGNRHIQTLLEENYRQAKVDRALLLLLSAKYIGT